MKKMWVCIIAVLMLAALCACGSQGGVVPENPAPAAPVGTAGTDAAEIRVEYAEDGDRLDRSPAAGETASPQTTASPVEAEPSEPEAGTDTLSAAQGLIGEDVALLYAAIGEPNSSDYAPSCLVDGEDGELYYDEFVVYTQRTANGETVYYVE